MLSLRSAKCRPSATSGRQPRFSKALQCFLAPPGMLGRLLAWSETLERSLTSLSLSVLFSQTEVLSVL